MSDHTPSLKDAAFVVAGLVGLGAILLGVFGNFETVRVEQPPGAPLEVARDRFPHEAFDRVLKRVVNDRGQVDYKRLAEDRTDLERYLAALQQTSPQSNPELFTTDAHRLSYWLNAYNAFVLYGVTARPKLRAVGDVKSSFLYLTRYVLGGEPISLHDLENTIIRETFREPRIHFALNCASAACPELPAEAFTPDALEAQLARGTRAFCADPKKVRVEDNTVHMSEIFQWYLEDFEAAGGPVAFCRRWGRTDFPPKPGIAFIPYDWSLNAQPGRAPFE